MKVLYNKSITDVTGFKAAGISCGIKKSGKKDLCLIYSTQSAVAGGAFTTNKVKAAPLTITAQHLENQNTQAIIINSGNANACTGAKGLINARAMADTTAKALGLSSNEVLVSSTGIIGVQMPMDKIIPGIDQAASVLSHEGGHDAASAIMTTDTFSKKITVEVMIGQKPVLISGIAKGSGMIHPNMATMLGFIVTDANISKELLTCAIKDSVVDSFNMISVDGDTSTNDMVIVMANGASGHDMIIDKNQDYHTFKAALDFVNVELSKQIAKDGEGATKLIEVSLSGGRSKDDARLCAKSVISSNLVKSAFFGSDANWGRIMCALGYSQGNFVPEMVDIFFKNSVGVIQLVQDGAPVAFSEGLAKDILDQEYVNIVIDLKDGEHSATAWGCDLSYDYVKINGAYRT